MAEQKLLLLLSKPYHFLKCFCCVGSDIRTALFLQGGSGVSGHEAQGQPLEKHQKHTVEILQFIYPTRLSETERSENEGLLPNESCPL